MSKTKCVLPKEPGVYACVHIPSGAKYIGSTLRSMLGRERGHLTLLRKKNHHARRWQTLYDQDGPEAFAFSMLERAVPEDVRDLEQEYIDSWIDERGREMLMNAWTAASGPDFHTEETRKRMSESQLRRHESHPEYAEASSERMRRLAEDPVFAAEHLERLRKMNENPIFIAAKAERMRKLHEDPVFAFGISERMRKRHENPTFATGISDRMRKMRNDPDFAALNDARLRLLNEDPEFQTVRIAGLLAVMSDPTRMAEIVAKRAETRAGNKDAISASISASASAFWADPIKKAEMLKKCAATRAKKKAAKAASLLEAK